MPAPGKHTWEDGFNACRSLSFAKQQLANPKKKAEKTAGGQTEDGRRAPAKAGSGAGEAASTALGLEDTVSEDDQNKNLLAEAIVGETRKCDSEREEWCAGAANTNPNPIPNPKPNPNPNPNPDQVRRGGQVRAPRRRRPEGVPGEG